MSKLTFNVRRDLKKLSVQELLVEHQKSSHKTPLSQIIGDGHLYDRVLVFRNIRDVFLKLGGQFTEDDQIYYRTLPFAALPQILASWQVPTFANVQALRFFEEKFPLTLTADSIILPATAIQKNYLLHEISHCLLDCLIPSIPVVRGIKNERKSLIHMLMGEAFANTTATLCAADLHTKVDLAFYALNDYGYCLDPIRGDLMKRFVKIYGYRHAFKFLFFGHFILKFLAASINRRELIKLLGKIDPDLKIRKQDLEWVTQLINSMLQGHDFLIELNTFYFKLVGMKTPMNKLLSFDFIKELTQDPILMKGLDTLADLIEFGVLSPKLSELTVHRTSKGKFKI